MLDSAEIFNSNDIVIIKVIEKLEKFGNYAPKSNN